jgi:hypothetical protein
VYPAALAVACVCVIISRAAHFEPGYLYGILMGVTLSRDLSLREEGESLTFYYAATLALSLLAWILWIPVKTAAQGPQPSLPAMILDVALPASFIGGVQGALFSLAPMRFQPGLILKKWNARVWFGFLLLSLFLLLHILVHPAPASNPSALITVLILFALFGLASVGLWLYFRLRGEHEPTVVMAREP